jgi:hypothetical protein
VKGEKYTWDGIPHVNSWYYMGDGWMCAIPPMSFTVQGISSIALLYFFTSSLSRILISSILTLPPILANSNDLVLPLFPWHFFTYCSELKFVKLQGVQLYNLCHLSSIYDEQKPWYMKLNLVRGRVELMGAVVVYVAFNNRRESGSNYELVPVLKLENKLFKRERILS